MILNANVEHFKNRLLFYYNIQLKSRAFLLRKINNNISCSLRDVNFSCETMLKLVAFLKALWYNYVGLNFNYYGGIEMKAVKNGKIILKDRILDGYALLFTDVIEGIVPTQNIPQDAEIIDAAGGYVSPGLIDLHIHGYLGKDVCDGEEESIRTIAKGLVANGVTGFLPTTIDRKSVV